MTDLFIESLIERNVKLEFSQIGNNLSDILLGIIKKDNEGFCLKEGYIKPDSCNIVSYSSGFIEDSWVSFIVIINCKIFNPAEGHVVSCKVINITAAGIRGESSTDTTTPFIIFIAKDHHYTSDKYSDVNEGDTIDVTIVGIRYEVKDTYISLLGEYI